MKRFLFTLTLIAAMAIGASAQKAQLQIGYDGYTMMDACDMHDGGPAVNTAWGAVTAGVNFKVAPKFSLGASYTFSSTDRKHIESSNIYYHVIMLNARYDYWRNSVVQLYGHLGVGADISHITYGDESKNKGYFACQVSPLGAEVGLSRSCAMFGELGFGAQGLVQVGFRLNL